MKKQSREKQPDCASYLKNGRLRCACEALPGSKYCGTHRNQRRRHAARARDSQKKGHGSCDDRSAIVG